MTASSGDQPMPFVPSQQVPFAIAGSRGSHTAWETGRGGSFKGPAPGATVDVMTYDDSSPGQVAPVSAESALAAFNDACGDSFHRREEVNHPAMHIGKSGMASTVLLPFQEPISAVP